MKKVEFGFLCNKDPMQMPASGHTRHCSQCAKNIVDFTGMTSPEIAAHLKKAARPCGFMLPWQLEELNAQLRQERSHFVLNRLSRLAQIAAVVSAPLVIGQASAQTTDTNITHQNGRQQGTSDAEIMVLSATGTALRNILFEVFNTSGETIARLTTDDAGKIYLGEDLRQQGTVTLKNSDTGLEKVFTLTRAAVCMVWQTRLAPQAEKPVQQKEQYFSFAFRLIKEDLKTRNLSSAKVVVSLYDSANVEINTLQKQTNRKGQLKLSDGELKGVTYLLFSIETDNGNKTAYATLSQMDLQKPNVLEIHDYERFMMGIMIEP